MHHGAEIALLRDLYRAGPADRQAERAGRPRSGQDGVGPGRRQARTASGQDGVRPGRRQARTARKRQSSTCCRGAE